MNSSTKLKVKLLERFLTPRYQTISDKENSIQTKYPCIQSLPDGPIRFEIPLQAINYLKTGKINRLFNFQAFPIMAGSMMGIFKGFKLVKKNSPSPKTKMEQIQIKDFEKFCESIGVGMVGYCKLQPEYIFRDKGILYENCIVLIMEMQKHKIDTSPSYDAFHEVHRTYRDLGFATNKVATYLLERGFGAHPVHPLGGAVLTPPLAKLAGLGWEGRHGMIITPKFGPRMRIATVFTSITNLPIPSKNPHEWIANWCKTCGVCIHTCPTSAIRPEAIKREKGLQNHIDVEKCFPNFIENHGCSVCIKNCTFNTMGYAEIKAKYEKHSSLT